MATKESKLKRKIKVEPDQECDISVKKIKLEPDWSSEEDKIGFKQEVLKEICRIKSSKSTVKIEPLWKDHELLSESLNIESDIAYNIKQLFDDDNTIPFIARYRKDITKNMSPEELREVKKKYDEILALKAKIETVIKSIQKLGRLDSKLNTSVLNCKTVEELEHFYAPYKPSKKGTLVERAKSLGLEEPALKLLENKEKIDLSKYIDKNKSDLQNMKKVETGVVHVIAHILSTDIEVLVLLRKLRRETNFMIEVKRKKIASNKTKDKKKESSKDTNELKYETYFDFKAPLKHIKPHHVLAINRGESQKVLVVKILFPDFIFEKFHQFCVNKWGRRGCDDESKRHILEDAMRDSFTRILQPLIIREIRAELKQQAERASFEVFSDNLKQVLLAVPIKGRPILGVDPGFTKGVKVALISSSGDLLDHKILYPFSSESPKSATTLVKLLQKHSCNLIALGNGTACRETESWLSNLIKDGSFKPLDVTYTIVSECGASIYSCSEEAKKEFPKLDPNIISAVSLARRIQDPLAELVKVEPKHLGIGMYQHDLPKKQLEEALSEVISECVSFVGVDLNTASQCLLRRIAGLSDKRATQIMEYRTKNGPFINRKDLVKVKGIGPKIFKQCAGFLRVGPLTVEEAKDFYKTKNTNRLDCTIIHPESYDITLKLMKHFNIDERDIGEESFRNKVSVASTNLDYEKLSKTFDTNESTLRLITESLSKPMQHDLRHECPKTPLFKSGLVSLTSLNINSHLTGQVSNVTHFGCFVDIGVGQNGLIHVSKMMGKDLKIGDRVTVEVLNLDITRKRIGLKLVNVLS